MGWDWGGALAGMGMMYLMILIDAEFRNLRARVQRLEREVKVRQEASRAHVQG
jgi:hypothetical protein